MSKKTDVIPIYISRHLIVIFLKVPRKLMLFNLLMSLFGCRISANGAVQGGGAGDENEGVQQGGVDRVCAAGSRRA